MRTRRRSENIGRWRRCGLYRLSHQACSAGFATRYGYRIARDDRDEWAARPPRAVARYKASLPTAHAHIPA